MDAKSFLAVMHIAERLKDTLRHCTTSQRRVESVAEHSWRIALMAQLLRHEFPDTDIDKVTVMCLIHDLGECFTGDIPTFVKTDADRAHEDTLLEHWIQSLPPEIASDFTALFSEMHTQQTAEAKLFRALDKLEALIQHNESPLNTWSENEYSLNLTYAYDTVAFSDWLTSLRNEIKNETLAKLSCEGESSSNTNPDNQRKRNE